MLVKCKYLDEHGPPLLQLDLRVHAPVLDPNSVEHAKCVRDHPGQLRLRLDGKKPHAWRQEGSRSGVGTFTVAIIIIIIIIIIVVGIIIIGIIMITVVHDGRRVVLALVILPDSDAPGRKARRNSGVR